MQTSQACEAIPECRRQDHDGEDAQKGGKVCSGAAPWPGVAHDDLGDIGNLTNDQMYELLFSRMENEVVNLLALDDKAAKQFVGRTGGPQFVQRNALDNVQGGTRRTTAVSRAWRRTAGWLDDLLNIDRLLAWEAALLKILTNRHPSPPPLKATPEQIDGFKSFLSWRKRITREMLG